MNGQELNMFYIDIECNPEPWMRFGVNRRTGGIYDRQPNTRCFYKGVIASKYRDEPLTCPLAIDITFRMPVAKSIKGRMRRDMLSGYVHHTKKPDIDNLVKLVLDTMTGIVYKDDCQIIRVSANKRYSEVPGILVSVQPISYNAERQTELNESDFGQDWE